MKPETKQFEGFASSFFARVRQEVFLPSKICETPEFIGQNGTVNNVLVSLNKMSFQTRDACLKSIHGYCTSDKNTLRDDFPQNLEVICFK